MNRSSLRQSGLVVFALAAWMLAGCSSSPLSRIDQNRALYESWPVDMQAAVYEGKAVTGMTPDMVRMALGEPTRIEPRAGSTTGEETWIYEKGGGLNLPRPNISLGGGIGGVGVSTGGRRGGGGGSRNAGGSAQEQEIVFQNGVVTRVN
jgi:hypothetical protein